MTIQFRDSDGTTRLSGDVLASGGATGDVLTQQTDGTYAPAAGGSQPINAVYSGSNVSIGSGADALLTWDTPDSVAEVLDISVPAHPTALADGTYIVSAWVKSFPLTVGGFFQANLVLDPDEGIAEIFSDSAPDPGQSLGQNVCVSASAFIPAGGEINLRVYSFDGVAARNFLLKNVTITFIPS